MSFPDIAGLCTLLVIGLVLALGMVVGFTMYALTHPPRRTYASALASNRPGDPSELGPSSRTFRAFEFTSRGRQLRAWEIAGDSPQGPVVIMSHGWGDSRIGGLSRLPAISASARRVIAWDLPGHGDSPGICTLGTKEVDDLCELIALTDPAEPVVLMGWSLGAGISIAAGARLREEDLHEEGLPGGRAKIVAVFAEAPYRIAATPARNVMIAMGFPHRLTLPPAISMLGQYFGVGARWNSPVPFDRAVLASIVGCPLTVLHGNRDAISPIEDGQEIAAACDKGTMAVVASAGHHGLWSNAETFGTCASAWSELMRASGFPAAQMGNEANYRSM